MAEELETRDFLSTATKGNFGCTFGALSSAVSLFVLMLS